MGDEQSTRSKSQRDVQSLRGVQSSGGHDLVLSYGNAEANIINNGSAGIAMAHGSKGRAAAYSDGYEARIVYAGNGRAGVDGGLVWVTAGDGNVAAAFCNSAQQRNMALPSSDRNVAVVCNCGDSCSRSCACAYHQG